MQLTHRLVTVSLVSHILFHSFGVFGSQTEKPQQVAYSLTLGFGCATHDSLHHVQHFPFAHVQEHALKSPSGRMNVRCEEHPDDAVALYCKTCEKSICLKCYFNSNTLRKGEAQHVGHQVDTSEDAFTKEKVRSAAAGAFDFAALWCTDVKGWVYREDIVVISQTHRLVSQERLLPGVGTSIFIMYKSDIW